MEAELNRLEQALKDEVGERCETKDTKDFPGLSDASRCYTCLVYEKFDDFIASLSYVEPQAL